MQRLLKFVIFIFVLTACNTLYHNNFAELEIFQPARVVFPSNYKTIVLKYNNTNVAYNSDFGKYVVANKEFVDNTNLDSIASLVFFDAFQEQLKTTSIFDSIITLPKTDFSELRYKKHHIFSETNDTVFSKTPVNKLLPVTALATFLNIYAQNDSTKKAIPFNFELGLYSKNELQELSEITGGDLLISLDFFASMDGQTFNRAKKVGYEVVLSTAFWSLYDLKNQQFTHYYQRIDTVTWKKEPVYIASDLKKVLPPRKDAVLNGAEVSGTNFANFLIPHWINVQRVYYKSGHVDFKQTENLIKEGEWLQAAEIWKNLINNPNKKIAAKSMFNLAIACEIEGDLDAALDWVVKSYYLLGNENELHAFHCKDYIQILAQRKVDFEKLNMQINKFNLFE